MKKVIFFILFMLHTMLFSENLIIKNEKTIESRFLTPNGYEREIYPKDSFGAYLRNLNLLLAWKSFDPEGRLRKAG